MLSSSYVYLCIDTVERSSEQHQLGLAVAGYFTPNPKYTFEGFAGLGHHGGALILSEKGSNGMEDRKVVIKYSLLRLIVTRPGLER